MDEVGRLKHNIFELEKQLNQSRIRLRDVLDENSNLKAEIEELKTQGDPDLNVRTICAQDKAHK